MINIDWERYNNIVNAPFLYFRKRQTGRTFATCLTLFIHMLSIVYEYNYNIYIIKWPTATQHLATMYKNTFNFLLFYCFSHDKLYKNSIYKLYKKENSNNKITIYINEVEFVIYFTPFTANDNSIVYNHYVETYNEYNEQIS